MPPAYMASIPRAEPRYELYTERDWLVLTHRRTEPFWTAAEAEAAYDAVKADPTIRFAEVRRRGQVGGLRTFARIFA